MHVLFERLTHDVDVLVTEPTMPVLPAEAEDQSMHEPVGGVGAKAPPGTAPVQMKDTAGDVMEASFRLVVSPVLSA